MKPLKAMPAPADKYVALTFDDGPHSTATPALLDILEAEGVPATFFVVGSRAAALPGLVRRAMEQGMGIGVHGWEHVALVDHDRQFVVDQLTRTLDLLWSMEADPFLFRPPFGKWNEDVVDVADQLGLTTVLWDVAPKDWTAPGAETITERVTSGVKPGSIVLFHDHGPGTPDTIAALPRVIGQLRDDGVSFVELGACLVPR